MRRLISTLAILLVVLISGMTALVLLVNPNDFRDYMVQQVEQCSGYQLSVGGDLRWHVWPQLSILSGRMMLTAPGAAQPVVTAENMRLDVHLLPLLSHQLSVSQVMLKGAVLRLTPDSSKQRPRNAPVAPAGTGSENGADDGWSFDIEQLRISDSLLIWQQADGEEFNLRDLNLSLAQNSRRDIQLQLSSQLNRNQQSLQFTLNGNMDVSQYPQRLSGRIRQLAYRISGADLPGEGIQGQATLEGEWRHAQQRFVVKNLAFSANDSQITGSVSGTLQHHPWVEVDLQASRLNLDTLPGTSLQSADAQNALSPSDRLPPVIAQAQKWRNEESPLNAIDGKVQLAIASLQWRGMTFNQVQLEAASYRGLLQIADFTGKSADGNFSLPASIDVRQPITRVSVDPLLRNIDVAMLLKGLQLPAALQGKLSMTGHLQGEGMGVELAQQNWQGQAELSMTDARFASLNFARMIQRTAQRSNIPVQEHDATLQQLAAQVSLKEGILSFRDLQGRSAGLTLQGEGDVNLLQRSSDMRFAVTVSSGWQGDSEQVQRLRTTAIPLRIYGPWQHLSYALQLDEVLRDQITEEVRTRFWQWMNTQKNSDNVGNINKQTDNKPRQ